jgi:hypothetical protein
MTKMILKEYLMKKRSSSWAFLQIVLLLHIFIIAESAAVHVMVFDTQSGKNVDSAIVEIRKDGVLIASARSDSAAPVTMNLSGSYIINGDKRFITNSHVFMNDGYPNPATNRVHFEIYLQNYLSELQINIYNILAQRISTEKMIDLSADSYHMLLDVASLASSVYFIELISSQGERITGKFVKIGDYSFNSIPGISFRRTATARHMNKKITAANHDNLKKNNADNEYDFRVFTDDKSKILDTKNSPSDIAEGAVGVFGYVNTTIIITGDTSITLEMDVNYRAPRATVAPVIDGIGSDACWQNADWAPIDHLWLYALPSAADFSGRYKIVWTPAKLYYLVEIVDDSLSDVYANPLTNYYMDDCLEFFIDEDHSGGDHTYNFNAFAYHIALDSNVIDNTTTTSALFNDYLNEIARVDSNAIHKSIWEVAVDIYDDSFVYGDSNAPVPLSSGKKMGFAIAYCDNDGGTNRESFIGSIFIDGNFSSEEKNVAWQNADVFATLELVDEE